MKIDKLVNKVINQIKRHELILFFIALFLLKVPPFYVFVRSQFFTIHVVSKVIIVFLLLIKAIKNDFRTEGRKWVFVAVFLYLVSQSVSVINAENITYFWKKYQTIIGSITLFYLSYLMAKDTSYYKKIMSFVYFAGLFMVTIEFFLYVFPGFFMFLIKYFFQREIADLYLYNLNEGKYNLYTSIEIFLPFFTYETVKALQKNQKFKMFVNLSMICCTCLLTFVSQFRTRLLQLILALFLSIWHFLFGKINRLTGSGKNNLKLALVILILFVLFFKNTGLNLIKRTFLPNSDDKKTVLYRFTGLAQSYKLFLQSPIFGVGLGNYKYYINNTNIKIENNPETEHSRITLEDPHGIISETIAETGLFGFIATLLMLLIFIIEDGRLIRKKNDFVIACIIASWTILIRGLVSPINTLYLVGWFWFFRGVVSASNKEDAKVN